ncbi:MAG: outer membrane protein assembly factor BamE [Betaproteobacteria bacterium]|nr:outer membrane protein assembly factor BamE [Betaproteobacteria bacterium]
MRRLLLTGAATLLGACAAPALQPGGGLVPGQSTETDVQRVMGSPAEKLAARGGGETWFYPTTPEGRMTYAARLQPDGVLSSFDQRLTKENISKVVEGKSTREDVRELFGPPFLTYRTRLGFEEWDYRVEVDMRKFDFLVDFGDDGIVKKAWLLHDPIYDAPGPRG